MRTPTKPDHDINLNDWIGRTEGPIEDIITDRLQAEFLATLGDHCADIEGAPLGIHWCLSPPAVPASGLGPDGHPLKGGFLPPVPLPRRMWASGSIEFIEPLKPGDPVSRSSQIKSIAEKSGSTGQLVFVTVQHEISTASGLAIREDHNIVYREAATRPVEAKAARPAPDFAEATEFAVDTVTLFRYSAMTFNGHRIHYDAPYAREVEHYPDVVIHGPLQATLMMNFGAKLRDKSPAHFSYRGIAPATGSQLLTIGASTEGDDMALSVVSETGVETMTAKASW